MDEKNLFSLAAELGLIELSDLIQEAWRDANPATEPDPATEPSPFRDYSRLT